ncbi:MAG: DNA alkylation repair protein [Actinomycetota bacterium]
MTGSLSAEELIHILSKRGTARNREGMRRFGINVDNAVGVSMTELRKLARPLGRDHKLAGELWRSGIHEARILASIVDDPARVTEAQMERWIRAFESWDLCDQVCMNLFDKTPFAYDKALEWSERKPEFQKRAGFALMACLAWHDRDSPDTRFREFLPVIEREADDDRNFVKKSVNWALRQIGKRSPGLRRSAMASAKRIAKQDSRSAHWIASDALRELSKAKR